MKTKQKKIKVGLVQIGDKFGDQYYLPYSIGVLQAYAQKNLKNPEDYEFLIPVYKRIFVKEAANYLSDADVVFFSSYVWNFQINLKIAKWLKEKDNECMIIFGGPQVPESRSGMKTFLNKYPFIDIGSYGEGEMPFLLILENIKKRSWENIPSIGFMKGKDFIYNKISERIKNLDEVPSPYLEGIFDSLIKANLDEGWSALLETNRGCPYSCSYCFWGTKTKNRINQYTLTRVFKEIDWFSKHKIQFVFCCDANFGILKRDIDIAKKVAENKKQYRYPEAFSVQNTKNSTEKIFTLQKILNDNKLQKGVNLALQSLNADTLKSINRSNISPETYKKLQHMFNQHKIATFSDMIIGLPNESFSTFADGVFSVIESGQHNRIQFINLVLLENTQMNEPTYQKKYGLHTVDSKIIPHHTSLNSKSVIHEIQKLVIATDKMPKNDWIKTRIFCWIVSLIYFNKLLQIPIMLINRMNSINFRELIEIFMQESKKHKVMSEILSFFNQKAKEIQKGGSEHVASQEWLNIWWPADEYIFIKLCYEDLLDKFYNEAKSIMCDFLPDKLLDETVRFNQGLLKLPFIKNDLDISLKYNIFEIYQGVLNGMDTKLKKGVFHYTIDRTSTKWTSWEEWFKEVVWYGTKKGAYLYSCYPLNNNKRQKRCDEEFHYASFQ
ncbi:MAG: radical SAM protein [Thermoplasmatales archaeon]|nr:radical SAM protein [Thermoplasmatales archaeon]